MNLRVVVRRRPAGLPEEDDFALDEAPLPEPREGQVLVRTEYLSLDPYMGSALKGRHMSGAIGPGDVMPGDTIGRVVRSRGAGFAEGDWVTSRGGWQAYSIADSAAPGGDGMAAALSAAATRLEPDGRVPVSAYLGVMGMPGLTAFAGTARVLDPGPGETFVVSAATGAVGSTAGQVARIMGARVVGIAGSEEKCAHAVASGFDACVSHRSDGFAAALGRACPDGIDAYFDTVGGALQATVFGRLAMRGRVMLCGMMDQYNAAQVLPGPSLSPILARRASITGFVVYDHWHEMARWRGLAAGWIADGRLTFKEDVSVGLEAAPSAFVRLMSGRNFGKTIIRCPT